jgi:hypothetical protein
MPNLPWPGRTICQLSLLASSHGSAVVNTFHYEASQADELLFANDNLRIAAGTALASAWWALLRADWVALHGEDYTVNTVRAQILEVGGQWRHRLTPTDLTLAGLNIGTITPPAESLANSLVIRWRTPQASKSTRGRSYVGPLPDAWEDNGRLTATPVNNANTFAATMLAEYGHQLPIAPSPWGLVVYSRPYNQGDYAYPQGKNPTRAFYYPPDYAGKATGVVSNAVDSVIRSQRRRQLNVGA